MRQDSAHDALENRLRYLEEEVDFIIQWNPRGEDPAHWLERAERHSEFKTDLDIERLPSGKFDTNDLVLAFAVFAYNILRFIGLIGLTGESAPLRHPAKRRRIKTVLQELMYLAARLVATARRLKLRFSRLCPGFRAFEQVYYQLAFG